jgi:hypothetical protein
MKFLRIDNTYLDQSTITKIKVNKEITKSKKYNIKRLHGNVYRLDEQVQRDSTWIYKTLENRECSLVHKEKNKNTKLYLS